MQTEPLVKTTTPFVSGKEWRGAWAGGVRTVRMPDWSFKLHFWREKRVFPWKR
jgi:hypothetical protein